MSARVGRDRAAELQPDYPLHDFEPIVDRGAVRDRGSTPTPRRARPATAPAGLSAPRPRGYADLALAVAGRAQSRDPAAARGRRDFGTRIELVGPVRVVDRERQADPRERPAPGDLDPVDLRAGRSALPVGHPGCPFDVSGFGFAGMPGVVIGKNASIAWGLTTSYADVQDLYLEQVRDNTVRDGDALRPAAGAHRGDHRGGRGGAADDHRPSRPGTGRSSPTRTRVCADVGRAAAESEPGPFAVSLAWTGVARRTGRWTRLFQLNTATTFAEFRAGAKLLAAPSQNLVYADTDGQHRLPAARCDPRARRR